MYVLHLSNRMSYIIGGYIIHRKFAAFVAFSFIIFFYVLLVLFYYCVFGCMFCILLFNSISYVFLSCLCILIIMYVLFCVFCFHRANWHSSATLTEVSPCFSSAVRQTPMYNWQRPGTASTLPKLVVLFCVLFVSIVLFCVLFVSILLFCVLFVSIVLFCVLFVCKCVLCYCHQVSTHLQTTNVSVSIFRESFLIYAKVTKAI